jgi:hypothetical protein
VTKKLFDSKNVLRLCGFRHSEESMKTRLALCVMVINSFLDSAALKVRRQRIKCFKLSDCHPDVFVYNSIIKTVKHNIFYSGNNT